MLLSKWRLEVALHESPGLIFFSGQVELFFQDGSFEIDHLVWALGVEGFDSTCSR